MDPFLPNRKALRVALELFVLIAVLMLGASLTHSDRRGRARARIDIRRSKQGLAMDVDTNLRAGAPSALEFVISLHPDRSFVVWEKHGRSGGVFAELSGAILYVREECHAHGCAMVMKFDQNLACIRAAG